MKAERTQSENNRMDAHRSKEKAAAPGQKVEQLARQMVLAGVNLHRAEAHQPPLASLSESAWLLMARRLYGKLRP